ncbi:MAG: hypothetical protein U0359_39655 [Byssovorax sp.]
MPNKPTPLGDLFGAGGRTLSENAARAGIFSSLRPAGLSSLTVNLLSRPMVRVAPGLRPLSAPVTPTTTPVPEPTTTTTTAPAPATTPVPSALAISSVLATIDKVAAPKQTKPDPRHSSLVIIGGTRVVSSGNATAAGTFALNADDHLEANL